MAVQGRPGPMARAPRSFGSGGAAQVSKLAALRPYPYLVLPVRAG